MKPYAHFVTLQRGTSRLGTTRISLQLGGDPKVAEEAGRKLVELSRRVKVGKKLGASELIRAERG